MPVMSLAAILSARAHDQADARARDHALCMGASGRRRNPISARLSELDGGDRPLPIVASDRDSQAVHFVKPNALHRTGLSIRENHGPANKLSLSLLELAEDRGRTE